MILKRVFAPLRVVIVGLMLSKPQTHRGIKVGCTTIYHLDECDFLVSPFFNTGHQYVNGLGK
jgi:hypothetical protein